MERNLTAGIVGGGGIATTAHVPAYLGHPAVDSLVVAEIDDERRRKLAAEYDVHETYRDGEALIEDADLDVLSICTPPNTHESLFDRAAGRGIDVYCEKPLATDLASARRMAARADDAGIVTQIGYTRPYVKSFRRLLDVNERGLLGTIDRLETVRVLSPPNTPWYYDPDVAGGGIVADQFPHVVDFYLRLFEQSPTVREVDLRGVHTGDVEDYAEVTFEFGETTVRTVVHWSHRPSMPGVDVRYHRNLLLSDAGHVRYDMDQITGVLRGNRFEFKRGSPPLVKLYSLLQLWGRTRDDYQTRRIVDFVDHVVAGDTETAAPVGRGVEVRQVIESIYEEGER